MSVLLLFSGAVGKGSGVHLC